ncbi:MAG: NAD(P)/FAD-dependent oxidoreductase [Burkholderiaceae bacterium]|nr:NAD(P)/FAD-dependent oxidoreductase [Burkholderiaceae bacterium]MDH3460492.1 NAD(P)/FAD-dependent oxidoreductase [Burkholderiaceae bacterium]
MKPTLEPVSKLPAGCEVLVIGAGPAGSACARTLAQAGVNVVLADQYAFPRDKVCGDGLIPDAHAALARLGVLDQVMAQAQAVSHVGCVGPSGGRIEVPGTLAVLQRRTLDDILCKAAVSAGARLLPPARFDSPLESAGAVTGARLKVGDVGHELHAQWLVLATGAVPQALIAAGMCERRTPSGIALRGYVKNDAMTARIKTLDVVWHRRLKPGYGWIFPCRDGVFNIGVGIAHSHNTLKDGRLGMKDVNLREVFAAFTEVYAPARELMAGGQWLGELKGAPLRCTLEGARFSRPGLLVTGEAAGATYSFSGEGIGKALETGIHAAQAILEGRAQQRSDAAVRADYEARLRALKPRFDLYEKANRVNLYPWLADLVIWRARKSARLLQRMSGVLCETSNPGNLLSIKGFRRLFLE